MLLVMRCSMRTSLRGKSGFFTLQSFLPFFDFSVSWPLVPHGQLNLTVTGSLAHQTVTTHSRARPGNLEVYMFSSPDST